MKVSFEQDPLAFSVELTPDGSGKGYRARLADETVHVELVQAADGRLDLLLDGKRMTVYVSAENARRWVTVNGQTVLLTKSSGVRQGGRGHHQATGALRVTAPMPGQVRAVNVGEGDKVTKGQTLLVLEAMKMEIRVQALQNGIVEKLFVEEGQTVEREQMLIEIEAG